jgi:hypothetical protein
MPHVRVYHALDFDQPPAPGSILAAKDHAFAFREVVPYTRVSGADSYALLWETSCKDCNAPVAFKTPMKGRTDQLIAHCEEHRPRVSGGGNGQQIKPAGFKSSRPTDERGPGGKAPLGR